MSKTWSGSILVKMALVLCVSSALLSCATNRGKDWVATQWREAMDAYHLNAVYPITEDIYVGDLFVVALDEGDRPTRSRKIGHISMKEELNDYYQKVATFPDTGAPPEKKGEIWTQKLAEKGVFESPNKRQSLPLAAFPGFSISTKAQGSGSGAFPIQAFFATIGGAFGFSKDVTVSIPAAETYGVPAADSVAKIQLYCRHDQKTSYQCSRKFANLVLGNPEPKAVAIYLIDRLYLARSLSYTYEKNLSAGAEAKLSANLLKTISYQEKILDKLEKPGATVSSTVRDAAGPVGKAVPNLGVVDNAITPLELAELRQQLDVLTTAAGAITNNVLPTPGTVANVSFGYAQGKGISMVQMFERPVVVGYGAVKISVIEAR